MNEPVYHDFLVVAGSIAAVAALVMILLVISLFFKKIEEVENLIATPGKQLAEVRKIWGNGPIGRWMRAMHICSFFLFRSIPRFGEVIASRMGDELQRLSLSDKFWAVIPVATAFLLTAVFFICASYL